MQFNCVVVSAKFNEWYYILAFCFPNTVQEEILAREIFGEIARLKHLANFTLTNDIWMY